MVLALWPIVMSMQSAEYPFLCRAMSVICGVDVMTAVFSVLNFAIRGAEMGDILAGGVNVILSLLPDSPFKVLDDLAASGEIAEWLGYVNWFVPIYSFVGIVEGWLLAIVVYYVYQVVLRWLGAIE